MKALRNLLILLGLIVVAGFFVPVDIRNGYIYYWYGDIVNMTGDTGKAAAMFKDASEAMPASATFARAYVRALNDIALGFQPGDSNSEQYYTQAYNFAKEWLEKNDKSEGAWGVLVERARAEWGLGRKNVAKGTIDLAVNKMPTDYEALVYQGIMHRDISPGDRNSVAASIPIFEQALEVRRETRTAWAHYEMAVAYRMINDENRALAEIDQCLAQWPDRALRIKAERLKNEIQSSGRTNR